MRWNTSEWLYRTTWAGTSTLTLQPKKPTTPEHSFRGTFFSSAQGGLRSFVTRPWHGRSRNMPVLSGTLSLKTTFWRLKMVHHRAARMVFSDYRLTSSVTHMSQQLQWPTRQECRAQAKVFMMYRIVYNLVHIPASHLTTLIPSISVRGHNMKFLVPYARTLVFLRSFFPDTIRTWNSFPSQ